MLPGHCCLWLSEAHLHVKNACKLLWLAFFPLLALLSLLLPLRSCKATAGSQGQGRVVKQPSKAVCLTSQEGLSAAWHLQLPQPAKPQSCPQLPQLHNAAPSAGWEPAALEAALLEKGWVWEEAASGAAGRASAVLCPPGTGLSLRLCSGAVGEGLGGVLPRGVILGGADRRTGDMSEPSQWLQELPSPWHWSLQL